MLLHSRTEAATNWSIQTENNLDQQFKEFTQYKVPVIFVKAKCNEELPSMDIFVKRENLMVLGLGSWVL